MYCNMRWGMFQNNLETMQKKLILFLLLILLVPLVSGICCEKGKKCIVSETCQDAACGDCKITVYNRSGVVEIPQDDMVKISEYTYTFNISKDELTYDTYPYTINCTDNKICQGVCQIEVMQECEGENAEYIFYIIAIGIFFLLVILGWWKGDGIFIMIAGMLAMIIGITLFNYGFPNLTNVFLKNSIVAVIWGVGAYLIIAPGMEFLGELK